jgi:hypothetical protein
MNVGFPELYDTSKKPPQLSWVWTEDRGMSFFLAVLVVVLVVVVPLAGLGLVERFLVDVGFSIMLISGAVARLAIGV